MNSVTGQNDNMVCKAPDMPAVAGKEVDIHLAEYKALRDEINHYSQRIDKMSGIYFTALLAIVGYFIRPGSTLDLQKYLEHIESTTILTVLAIFISIYPTHSI